MMSSTKRVRPPQYAEVYDPKTYETFNLWLDYWTQFELIKNEEPNSILEIGKGLGTLEFLLTRHGFTYTSLDAEPSLKPDIVSDITRIPLKDASVDVVCAFQVLEHIPFEDFEVALKEMGRVAKKKVIISIPFSTLYAGLAFSLFYTKYLDWLFKLLRMRPFRPSYFSLKIPTFFLDTFGMIPEHSWEMGRKHFPRSRIREAIKQAGFAIEQEQDRILYPYHYFFVLRPLR